METRSASESTTSTVTRRRNSANGSEPARYISLFLIVINQPPLQIKVENVSGVVIDHDHVFSSTHYPLFFAFSPMADVPDVGSRVKFSAIYMPEIEVTSSFFSYLLLLLLGIPDHGMPSGDDRYAGAVRPAKDERLQAKGHTGLSHSSRFCKKYTVVHLPCHWKTSGAQEARRDTVHHGIRTH